jgi:YD repeat-containing protein
MRAFSALAVLATTAACACTYSIQGRRATRQDFEVHGAVREISYQRFTAMYDGAGKPGLRQQELIRFDAEGHTTYDDQGSTITQYRYDALGRLILRQWHYKSNPTASLEYEFHQFSSSGVERITGRRWGRDEIRRYTGDKLVSIEALEGAPGTNVSYEYDDAGRETKRVTTITGYGNTQETTDYDQGGNIAHKKSCFSSGSERFCTTASYIHNDRGDLTSETHRGVREPCDENEDITDDTLSSETQYSPGRREEIRYRHGKEAERTIQEFDAEGRLTHEQSSWPEGEGQESAGIRDEWIEYEFDARGNWISKKVFEQERTVRTARNDDEDDDDEEEPPERILQSVEKRELQYYD